MKTDTRQVNTYSGYVFLWKLVGRVRDKEAGLTDGPVTHHHALDRLHVWLTRVGEKVIKRVFGKRLVSFDHW